MLINVGLLTNFAAVSMPRCPVSSQFVVELQRFVNDSVIYVIRWMGVTDTFNVTPIKLREKQNNL